MKEPLSESNSPAVEQTEKVPGPHPQDFYGWWIVLGCTAILFVSSGIGFYGHGVILDPLRERYGWSKGVISSAVSLYFFTAGVMGMLMGRFIDSYGPKPVLILGSVTMGIGFLLLSRVTQLWQFYAVYFIMALGWSGTSLIPVGTLIANWFIRKRGLAMSLTMTGLSLGGMVLVPLAAYLVFHWGLRVTLPILGAVYCLVIIPTAIWVIKQRPSHVGQVPDGSTPTPVSRGKPGIRTRYASQWRVWTRAEALRSAAFWAIVTAFMLALSGQIAFLVHQVSFLSQTLGPRGAALAVSVTAGASIIGRLFLGSIADRSDKRFLAMVCFFIQAGAVLSMAYFRSLGVLYLGTLAFGLTMGGIVMLQPLLIGECFGLVSFGMITGLAGLFSSSGAALGPVIAGLIYDATRDYRIAFTIFAAASLLAMVAVFFARPPVRPFASETGSPDGRLSPGLGGKKFI